MAFIVYKCLCWSFLFRFLTTSGKTLPSSPAPPPHWALKIATGVGLAQGFEFGVHSLCPLGHQFTLWYQGHQAFLLFRGFGLKFWEAMPSWMIIFSWLSGQSLNLTPPDPGINNLCCSAFASSLRSAVFTLSFAFFRIVLLAQVLRICIYPQTSQERIDQSMPHSFSAFQGSWHRININLSYIKIALIIMNGF